MWRNKDSSLGFLIPGLCFYVEYFANIKCLATFVG